MYSVQIKKRNKVAWFADFILVGRPGRVVAAPHHPPPRRGTCATCKNVVPVSYALLPALDLSGGNRDGDIDTYRQQNNATTQDLTTPFSTTVSVLFGAQLALILEDLFV